MKTKGQGHVQSGDRRNQHLDLRPPASRAARKHISVVEAPSVCGTCYSGPGKLTHQLSYRSLACAVTGPPQGRCTCCSLYPECSSPRHPHGFLPYFLQLAFTLEAFSSFPTSSHNILPPPPTHPIPLLLGLLIWFHWGVTAMKPSDPKGTLSSPDACVSRPAFPHTSLLHPFPISPPSLTATSSDFHRHRFILSRI